MALELPGNPATAVVASSSQLFQNAANFEIRGGQYVLGDIHNHHTGPSPLPSASLPSNELDEEFSESEVYCTQMLRRKRGFPLYEPAPQMNLPAAYRIHGVSIGDVGSVTPEGVFDFFFNIFLPPEHAINGHRTPDDFFPMPPYEPVDIFDLDFLPGNHVSTSTVQRLALDATSEEFPGGDFLFNCDGTKGAVLVLPYGAQLKKLRNVENIRTYVTEHAVSWYQYINGPRGRGLTNGELYVVTGCEKARSWGMSSYYANNEGFELAFKPTDGIRYRWSVTPGRKDPSQKKSYNCPALANHEPLNHTTFIHGLSISIGTGLWNRLFRTVTVETSSITDFYLRLNGTGGPSTAGSQGSSLSWSWNFFGGGGATKRYAGQHEDVILTDVPLDSGQVWNPAKLINEYILHKAPNATVVMSHDDDWSCILGDHPEITNPTDFLRCIDEQYAIAKVNGATFLVPKSSSSTVFEDDAARRSNDLAKYPAAHYGPHRYASRSPAARFQDHFDYLIPHGLPAMSVGMSRIDTQFTRRDAPLTDNQLLPASSVDDNVDSETWFPTQPAKPLKSRREKPRIELAPDQPPTTQGKPRARVYVACIQCRTRKIRCDGAKPVCHNCGKRASGSTECNYHPLPKRQGPDRTPGACQRVARREGGPRTRRRTSSPDIQDYIPNENEQPRHPFSFPSPTSSSEHSHFPEEYDMSPEETRLSPHETHLNPPSPGTCACHGLPQCPSPPSTGVLENQISVPLNNNSLNILLVSPLEVPVSRAFITDYEESDDNYQTKKSNNSTVMTIVGQPTLDFSRETWWDSLLSLYLSPTSTRLESISSSERSLATQNISADLRFLFRVSSYWFSFLHIPTFFSNFHDPSKRDLVQPSLILSALALGVFFQSSEIGMGQRGRERALRFREEAQSALEASLNAGWVDDTLAQAAWILAMFEICANPNHTSERSSSAMVTLDSIIRSLSLTMVDVSELSISTFSPGKVPAVADSPTHMGYGPQHHNCPYSSALPVSVDRGCSCTSLTLEKHWPEALEHTPLWAQTPAWNPSWSDSEIRKESIRRLCWSSIVLAAGHSSYSSATGAHTVNLFIADPSNYALLFSGEAMVHSAALVHPPSTKDTIWALYDRAFLLWHACIKMRNDNSAPVTDKGQFAIKAWLEADGIEETLNKHTCGIEKAFIFLGREYIFNTRMCVTYEFQRFVPLVSANVNGLFHRGKAEEWLSHQSTVAQQFMRGLHIVTGNSNNNLSRRPFFVFWFMGQVSRALTLWQCDNSMTIALDVCKTLLPPIDYLTALWPCAEQRYRYYSLRERLLEACKFAGIPLPPPLNLTLPASEFM